MTRTLRALCLLSLAHCGFTYAQAAGSSFNVVGTTIVETQGAIREGRTTCRAVVSGYLARIRAYDQTPIDGLRLNAIVVVNPNALAEADACDRNFAATHTLPPLGGIAVLIKDNYDTQGLQTTGHARLCARRRCHHGGAAACGWSNCVGQNQHGGVGF
jgi:amidase